jgi:hypothetical protein
VFVALAGSAVATVSGVRHEVGPGEARVGDETFAPPWSV